MKKIGVGLIGLGHLGKFHLKCLLNIPNVEVVGVYDSDQSICAEIAAANGIKAFNNPEELIEAADAIDVVTPTLSHFEYAAKVINANKHLFIEKPLTNTVAEAQALLDLLVAKPQLKVQVGHIERFNPAFVSIKHLSLNPLFVECHRLSQFNPRGTDVSVILDLMIHDLDLLLHIVPSEVKSIHASGVNVISPTPDISNVRIEFENGCVANLTASRISMKKMRKTRIFQKDAYISLDFLEKNSQVLRLSEEESEAKSFSDIYFPLNIGHGQTKFIALAQQTVDDYNAMESELKAFVDSIIDDSKPVVSIEDGFRALRLCHQIIDQIESRNSKLI
jgi:predicted dehydrogenase